MKLILIDKSGSTNFNKNYWKKVDEITKGLSDELVICFWNYEIETYVSQQTLETTIKNLKGESGTDPSCIAHFLRKDNNVYTEVVFISDGEVDERYIQETDKILKGNGKCNYKFFSGYLIGNSANLSVTAPFTREVPHLITCFDNELKVVSSISTGEKDILSLKKVDEIKTVQEFLKEYSFIEKALIAETIGLPIHNFYRKKLLSLQERLLKDLQNNKVCNDFVVALEESISSKNFQAIEENIKNILVNYNSSSEIHSKLSKLLNYTNGALVKVFDPKTIQANSYNFANNQEESQVPNEGEIEEKCEFICPILFEEGTPILLIKKKKEPFLADLDPKLTKILIENPFMLLLNDPLKAKFLTYIDHPISLSTFKAGKFKFSPFTRDEVEKYGICLGSNKECVGATNTALSKFICGGKRLGNFDLWFSAIYLLLKEVSYVSLIESDLKNHMIYRLNNSFIPLSLSGLTNNLSVRAHLKTALWFCLHGGYYQNKFQPKKESVRMYFGFLSFFRELLALVDFNVENNETKTFTLNLSFIISLLHKYKKNLSFIRNCQRGLYQKNLVINYQRIFFDGESINAEEILKELKAPSHLTKEEVYSCINAINCNMSNGDVEFPKEITFKKFEVNWGDDKVVENYPNVVISLKTCRPLYIIGDGKTWKDGEKSCNFKKYYPTTKAYMCYVCDYKKFPTRDEFLVYCYNKIINSGRASTLPIDIFEDFEWNRKLYKEVRENVFINEAILRFEQSINIEKRIKMECE